jgi:hypothetical protein
MKAHHNKGVMQIDPATLTTEQLEQCEAELHRRRGSTGRRPRKLTPCAFCGQELSARENRGSCPGCGKSPAQRKVQAEQQDARVSGSVYKRSERTVARVERSIRKGVR